MVHRPAWFSDDNVFVSYAATVGINKDGDPLYVIDAATGTRTAAVDDRVIRDIDVLLAEGQNSTTTTSRFVANSNFTVPVPIYYDERCSAALDNLLKTRAFAHFTARTLGDLIDDGSIIAKAGHGSPSSDLRLGEVPYIKVSDIRAGQVNINPSNLVPSTVAERYWRGKQSGLKPFDLVTPIRASKNIGEFAILMPGQERVVLTKEMLILRPSDAAVVDHFFVFWAMSLKAVRDQWKRIVFMQTNRDDVGTRYREVRIPWPEDKPSGEAVSQEFRDYYKGIEKLRTKFVRALEKGDRHHVFLGSSVNQGAKP